MTGIDWLSVVRVEKHDEAHQTTMVIADNGDAKHPFSRLSRYSVRFDPFEDMAIVTIYYEGRPLYGLIRRARRQRLSPSSSAIWRSGSVVRRMNVDCRG